jgi:sulfane dehydrogenase subunit SoxC
MDSKRSSRRDLLKSGALAAGAVATGASVSMLGSEAITPALAETPASGSATAPASYATNVAPMVPSTDETIAYGLRSHYVTSKRILEAGRKTPQIYTDFGLTTHVFSPLQDSYGTIQASSLHYFATTKGSFVPDLDPAQHTLTIQGLVDRPRIFTVAELKRLPSVTRFHFIECSINNHNATHRNVQESHGATSNAEWTGVLLSTLFKECGLQEKAAWFIAEGAEEVKGADTIPLAKGMDDVIVAYAMNGEPVRPQNGFPLRLVVPGFEGIFNTKWLRRIEVTDEYQLNMDDFGHLVKDATTAALVYRWGPKSVITFPSGSQKLPNHGWYEITGLAWSGQGAVRNVEISTDGGKSWKEAELKGTAHRMAHTRFGFMWNWDGDEHVIMSRTTDETGAVQPSRQQLAEFFKKPFKPNYSTGLNNTIMPWKVASDGSVTNGLA